MWLFDYIQRNDGKDAFVYQGFLFVLTAFSIMILEMVFSEAEGMLYSGQVSARASPLPSQCLPCLCSFFCLVICPDNRDRNVCVCVCVCVHVCTCTGGRGALNSDLQMGTADDHWHTLTSTQAKLTTLFEVAVEQSWHLCKIRATSSWVRMYNSQCG